MLTGTQYEVSYFFDGDYHHKLFYNRRKAEIFAWQKIVSGADDIIINTLHNLELQTCERISS